MTKVTGYYSLCNRQSIYVRANSRYTFMYLLALENRATLRVDGFLHTGQHASASRSTPTSNRIRSQNSCTLPRREGPHKPSAVTLVQPAKALLYYLQSFTCSRCDDTQEGASILILFYPIVCYRMLFMMEEVITVNNTTICLNATLHALTLGRTKVAPSWHTIVTWVGEMVRVITLLFVGHRNRSLSSLQILRVFWRQPVKIQTYR